MTLKNDAGSIRNLAADLRLRWTEREFQDAVVQLAKDNGWLVAHFRPARTSKGWVTPMQGDPGFPDLVMVRRGIVMFVELKAMGGKSSLRQKQWATALGGLCWPWFPADWNEILRVLA